MTTEQLRAAKSLLAELDRKKPGQEQIEELEQALAEAREQAEEAKRRADRVVRQLAAAHG